MSTSKPSRRPKNTTSRAGSSTARRRPSTRSTTTSRRRRTPKVATSLGAALGMLIVTMFTKLSWGQRIGLVVVVLVLGAGWVLWSHRQEIGAGMGPDQSTGPDPDPSSTPTTAQEPTP